MLKKVIALLLLVFSTLSFAQRENLGKNGLWSAAKDNDAGVCFIASFPENTSGTAVNRDSVYMVVKMNPATNNKAELSYFAGTTLNTEGMVLDVDGTKFPMKVDGNWAWTTSNSDDLKVVDAMIKGRQMSVLGLSADSKTILDTFSLKGVTASWNKAKEACNMN